MASLMPDHIEGLLKYLAQESEKANEDLILKYFRRVYGDDFTRQQDAKNCDGHVPGHFVLELKSNSKDWLSGLFQGIAYQRELDFSIVIVAAKGFLSAWRVEDIDDEILEKILLSQKAPNSIGKELARKYKGQQPKFLEKAIWNLRGELTEGLFEVDTKSLLKEIKSFQLSIDKQKRVRRKITTSNFTSVLKEMIPYFDADKSMKTVRAFYSMLFGWDEESRLEISQKNKSQAALRGELITDLNPGQRIKFKSFVDSHYICLRENENVDDFFAKYDEALDAVDSNFRRQHGIYFTNLDLSKFVMWYVRNQNKDLAELGKNYLVIDPACGSGNLVTNWRSPLELRHKVVSEIEPELLYTVEQRMKTDSWHNGKYTIIPKVEENKGLNFLDIDAIEYLNILKEYLDEKGHKPDKPLAFLCNPPYRNDDDQNAKSAGYDIHPSILELTGADASSERYCCFLAQMKLICLAARDSGLPGESLLLLFTKAAWLTQRPVFRSIRREMLSSFEDVGGVIVNGKEFFNVKGKFPIAFTIWRYVGHRKILDPNRPVKLTDLTWLKKENLKNIDWGDEAAYSLEANSIMNNADTREIHFGVSRTNIKNWCKITRYEFQREKRKAEKTDSAFRCGLPDGDYRHGRKKTLGEYNGEYIGFMDDLTPCRIKKDSGGFPWFRLNSPFMDCRKTRCFSGPVDQKGFCANSLQTAEKLFVWYSLSRVFATHGYPMWVDADELWALEIPSKLENKVTKICFAIGFSENECIEALFPANNPVEGSKEIVISNPMTPLDQNSFWSKTMQSFFAASGNSVEDQLVASVNSIYAAWETEFTSRKEIFVDYSRAYFIKNGSLFKFSGLVQIRDYAKENSHTVLLGLFDRMNSLLKAVKSEFNEMLMDENELNYFSVAGSEKNNALANAADEGILEKRTALASLIVSELHKENTFGRVKLAKVFYLLDSISNENLGTSYYREAAGPLDPYVLYDNKNGLEAVAEKLDYFITKQERKKNGDVQYTKVCYVPGANIDAGVLIAKKLFRKHFSRFANIINDLRKLNTERCELVATVYACWNDLLIEEERVSDQAIVDEFYYHWHKSKQKFKKDRVLRVINWMRKKGIVPTGAAKRTVIHRPPNQDDLFDMAGSAI